MKCSSIKTIKVAFRRPHPVGNFHDLLLSGHLHLRRQVSHVPDEADHYKQVKLHFLLSFKLCH